MHRVDERRSGCAERTPIRVAVGIFTISTFFCGVAVWLLNGELGSGPWVAGLVLAVWGGTGLLRGVGEVLSGVRRRD